MGQEEYLRDASLEPEDGYMESGRSDDHDQLAMDFCGIEHCKAGHSFGPIARSVYIIHAVISGKGILRYRGETREVVSGQLFLLPSGEETFYRADLDDPWHYCWIAFHGTQAEELVRKIGFSRKKVIISHANPKALEKTIHTIMQYREPNTHDRLMRTGLLYQILAAMIAESEEEQTYDMMDAYSMSYAEYAAKYIRMHFKEKIRIGELAQHIGISRSYLVKVMKETMDMSPQEYLIEIRMERAAHLLNHTDDAIRDVALSCGYDDSLAFSKAFKHTFGTNPSDFRRKYREEHLPEDEGLMALRSRRSRE